MQGADIENVSVVIPAFNAAGTICEALDSVAGQTVPPPEVLVIDDCSSDDTFALAEGHSSRPRVFRTPVNGGPAAARNLGIEKARGEWLAFLDGDDTWLPHRLEAQLELARKHPDVVLWCGKALRVQADGRDIPEDSRQASIDERALAGEIPATGDTQEAVQEWRRVSLREFAVCNPVSTSSVLVRKSAVESVGGFDTGFRGPEDYDLWVRIAATGAVALMGRPLCRYRCTSGSLSMDDRRFLPQVLGVLRKAFAGGGALRPHLDLRWTAVSLQYQYGSWMAFNRGARVTALRYYAVAWVYNLMAREKIRGMWLRILWRYVFGKREVTG